MPTGSKRPLSSATRPVSPPAIRKKPKICDHSTPPKSDSSVIKVYSWNVNGVGPLLQKHLNFTGTTTFPLRSFLKDHDWPHLLCLQEIKISSSDEVTQRRFEQAANAGNLEGEPTYTTHFSLPTDKYNAIGLGGRVHGVATLIRDGVLSQSITITKPTWDLEGRVLIHDLAPHNLVVVNGYWPNGTTNPYRNPDTGALQGTRHDHKLRFHEHILDLSLSTESRGKSIILVGDMNVAPTRIDGHPNLRTSPIQHVKNRADFNSKFFDHDNKDGLRGVDVFRHIHGNERRYTYHGRRVDWGSNCDRVDLIIASRELVEADGLHGTDICDNPKDRGHSDHVPIWVAVDLEKVPGPAESRGSRDKMMPALDSDEHKDEDESGAEEGIQ